MCYYIRKVTFFQVILLALVQGLTEFLPVSSSGHLVIVQKLLGISQPPVVYDVLVHLGTLAAVLIYFRYQWPSLSRRLLLLILIGSLPAGLAGLFLESRIEMIFSSLTLVGFGFLLTSIFLLLTYRLKKGGHSLKKLGGKQALIIGLFQALAILPGVSRSGATISGGLLTGLKPLAAFLFSFFLAVPAIGGAALLQLPQAKQLGLNFWLFGLIGMVIAGIVGYLSLLALEQILRQTRVWVFGIYTLVLGLVILLINFF